MTKTTKTICPSARRPGLRVFPLLTSLLLAACAAPGTSTQPGAPSRPETFEASTELAIACRHDEALSALERTEAARGGSTKDSELQRVVLLRNAGRTMDAASALRVRNARDDVTTDDAVFSGNVVVDRLESIRAERLARTGSEHCD